MLELREATGSKQPYECLSRFEQVVSLWIEEPQFPLGIRVPDFGRCLGACIFGPRGRRGLCGGERVAAADGGSPAFVLGCGQSDWNCPVESKPRDRVAHGWRHDGQELLGRAEAQQRLCDQALGQEAMDEGELVARVADKERSCQQPLDDLRCCANAGEAFGQRDALEFLQRDGSATSHLHRKGDRSKPFTQRLSRQLVRGCADGVGDDSVHDVPDALKLCECAGFCHLDHPSKEERQTQQVPEVAEPGMRFEQCGPACSAGAEESLTPFGPGLEAQSLPVLGREQLEHAHLPGRDREAMLGVRIGNSDDRLRYALLHRGRTLVQPVEQKMKPFAVQCVLADWLRILAQALAQADPLLKQVDWVTNRLFNGAESDQDR